MTVSSANRMTPQQNQKHMKTQNQSSKKNLPSLPHTDSDELEIQKICDEIDNQSLPERAWNVFVDIGLVVVFGVFLPISAIAWQAASETQQKYDECLQFQKQENNQKSGFEDRFRILTNNMNIDVDLHIQSWGFFLAFGLTLIVFGVVYALWKAGYLLGSPPHGKQMSMFNLTRFVFRATLSLGSCICLLTMLWPMYLACQTTSCLQGLLVNWADEHFWAVRFVALKLKFGKWNCAVPPLTQFLQKALFLLIPYVGKKAWSSIGELHSQQKFMVQEQVTLQEGLGRLNDRIEDVTQIAKDVGDEDVTIPNRQDKKAARQTLIELSKLGLLQDHMKWFDKNQVEPFFHDPDKLQQGAFKHMTPDPHQSKPAKSRLSHASITSSQLNTPGSARQSLTSANRASSAPVVGSGRK